jgi:hypothetical protein
MKSRREASRGGFLVYVRGVDRRKNAFPRIRHAQPDSKIRRETLHLIVTETVTENPELERISLVDSS